VRSKRASRNGTARFVPPLGKDQAITFEPRLAGGHIPPR